MAQPVSYILPSETGVFRRPNYWGNLHVDAARTQRKEAYIALTTEEQGHPHLSRREWRRRRSWRRFLPEVGTGTIVKAAVFCLASVTVFFVAISAFASETSRDASFYSGIRVVTSGALEAPQPSAAESKEPTEKMTASYYGREFAGLPTASGPEFDPKKLTAAHKSLPLGTKLLISRKDKSVQVTVTDRGPYIKGREIDLSKAAAKEIGLIKPGVAEVQVTKR